jgi:hypothetical protein
VRPGLGDRPSAPQTSPTQLAAEVVAQIEVLRRTRKWSARRIAIELAGHGVTVAATTVGRWLVRLGLNQRRHLDPAGENNRIPRRITARYPGHLVHLDVKNLGAIPAGGGWRAHGRDSAQHRAAQRAKATAKTRGARTGYVYLHTAIDGYSRLAYTEHLTDEKVPPRPGSGSAPGPSSPLTASPGSPASSPTTAPATAPPPSPTPWPAPRATNGSGPTPPSTTARSSATTGSSPRNSSTPAPGPQNTNAPTRSRPGTSTTTTIDPTPPPATSHQPPDCQPPSSTS